jgi:hypothetical protein
MSNGEHNMERFALQAKGKFLPHLDIEKFPLFFLSFFVVFTCFPCARERKRANGRESERGEREFFRHNIVIIVWHIHGRPYVPPYDIRRAFHERYDVTELFLP